MVAAPDGDGARDVLVLIECVTLTTALRASGIDWARPALGLIVLAASLAIVQLVVSGSTVVGLVALLQLVLVGSTIAVIALGVVDQREVNRQSISGAVCVYLLIGFLYTFAYGAVAALGSSDFFAQGTDGTTAIRVYFSYVTLATLGYGDYTAARTLGRSLAVSEALFGQLYLVTVVALLVGSFGQSRREPRRSPEA
jgi:Ion channel